MNASASAGAKPTSKPNSKSASKSASKSKSTSISNSKSKPTSNSNSKSKPKPTSQPKSNPNPKPNPKSKPQSQLREKGKPQSKPKPQPKRKPRGNPAAVVRGGDMAPPAPAAIPFPAQVPPATKLTAPAPVAAAAAVSVPAQGPGTGTGPIPIPIPGPVSSPAPAPAPGTGTGTGTGPNPPATLRLVGDPAFSSIELNLNPREAVLGGEGRMLFRSGEVETKAKTQGLGKAIARGLAGAGLAINEFTGVGAAGGMVAFSGIAPGGMVEAKVTKTVPLVLSRQVFICCDTSIEIGAKFNFRGLFEVGQDEGFLLPRAAIPPDSGSDSGRIWLSGFGHIQKHEVPPGQSLWVDNGCFVACTVPDPNKPPYTIDSAVKGLLQSLLTGEGFAMMFTGPVTVWTQNRNLNDFAFNVGRLINPPSALDAVEGTANVLEGIANWFGGDRVPPNRKHPKRK